MKKLNTSAVRVLEARAEANSCSFSKKPMLEPSKTTSNSRSIKQKKTRTVRDAVLTTDVFSRAKFMEPCMCTGLPQGEVHPATCNNGGEGVTGEGDYHRELTDII